MCWALLLESSRPRQIRADPWRREPTDSNSVISLMQSCESPKHWLLKQRSCSSHNIIILGSLRGHGCLFTKSEILLGPVSIQENGRVHIFARMIAQHLLPRIILRMNRARRNRVGRLTTTSDPDFEFGPAYPIDCPGTALLDFHCWVTCRQTFRFPPARSLGPNLEGA